MIKMRKVWSFLKTHWYIPLAIVGVVFLFFVSRGNSKALIEIIKKSRDSHKKEVDSLDNIHAEEVEKREVAIRRYHETVDEIEKNFTESSQALDKKKKSQIKKIIDEVGDDPAELTKRISELTGFDIVLPEN